MAFGIFSDDSADWTAGESVEDDFATREEAEAAVRDHYSEDDGLVVHEIEESDDDEIGDCDFCGGSGTDDRAADDGTADYDICPHCGGLG